ncbi:uncharacterized protein F5147DRAFT_649843 [Suillus discolor]|uniref:Uncharacterized protein n=1 Tax=Suillus discolor TaxID=1912936 RepID=A0A9P7FEH7_9AGAM|nr:uncharacterized protein F5147DRAFT_649843 [Suillus discolor]KAG2114678.1 hypothetical protein F5147DRAFT_649843 [Suillus discolor]
MSVTSDQPSPSAASAAEVLHKLISGNSANGTSFYTAGTSVVSQAEFYVGGREGDTLTVKQSSSDEPTEFIMSGVLGLTATISTSLQTPTKFSLLRGVRLSHNVKFIAKDTYAAAKFFFFVVETVLKTLFQMKVITGSRSPTHPPYSHPPNPDLPDWEAELKERECWAVHSQQIHTCKRSTCLCINQFGKLECK